MIGVRKNQSVMMMSRKLRVSRKKTFAVAERNEIPSEKENKRKSTHGKRIVCGVSGEWVTTMTTKMLGSAKTKLIMLARTVEMGRTSCGKRSRVTSDAEPTITLIDSTTDDEKAFQTRMPMTTK